MQGNDALRQIAANIIENIEIITNPSAQNDAEGASGIINIVLKKTDEYTLSGVTNANIGSHDKYSWDATINSNAGDFRVNTTLSSRKMTFLQTQDIDITSVIPSGNLHNLSYLNRFDVRAAYDGRLNIDYDQSTERSWSLSANYGRLDYQRDFTWNILSSLNDQPTFAVTKNNVDMKADYWSSTLFHSYKIQPKVDELTIEAMYTHVVAPAIQTTNDYTTLSDYATSVNLPRRTHFQNDIKRYEGRLKLDYTHTYSENQNLKGGLQANLNSRHIENGQTVYNSSIGLWEIDSAYTNVYSFRNNILAAYVMYSGAWDNVTYQLGLRGEYTDRLMEQQTYGEDFSYKKMDYFPTLSVSTKIFDDHQLQASYSKRINRPNDIFLNPYPYWNTNYAIVSGNPRLVPEFIDSYELNYQKQFGGVFFSAQSYYRSQKDEVQEAVQINDAGQYVSIFNNFPKSETYGLELTSSFTFFGNTLRMDPAADFSEYHLKGLVNNQMEDKRQFQWTARLNATLLFSADTRLQVSSFYLAPQIVPQNEIKEMWFLSATLRQDLLNKKLTLLLQARNVLNLARADVIQKGTNFYTTARVTPEVPVLSLNISYNFNNFKKPERGSENIDVNVGP